MASVVKKKNNSKRLTLRLLNNLLRNSNGKVKEKTANTSFQSSQLLLAKQLTHRRGLKKKKRSRINSKQERSFS